PGAVVTLALGKATRSRGVRAGGSSMSPGPQQLHFGLGPNTRVASLIVRYPWGGVSVQHNVRADQVLDVRVPPRIVAPVVTPNSYRLGDCTPSFLGRSIATFWQETAINALKSGAASEPVQARDLFDVSTAMWKAWAAAPKSKAARNAAISYAAYRVLLWQASVDSNLGRTFSQLTIALRRLCYSPDFSTTRGGSPAA